MLSSLKSCIISTMFYGMAVYTITRGDYEIISLSENNLY